MRDKIRHIAGLWAVTICRLALAATFMVSGFVKAVDPMGMFYKFNAYLTHWGCPFPEDSVMLKGCVILLAAVEFALGIYLLLGIRKRFTTLFALAFMVAMTIVSAYVYFYNPVSDCGCFGAAFTLTNGQTLAKNIVLIIAAIVVFKWKHYLLRLVSERNQWITSLYSLIFIVALCLYSLHYLPPIDFTDFKIGTDMKKAYYEADEQTPAMLVNFACTSDEGEIITDSILQSEVPVFLLTLPELESADDGCNDRINDIYDACRDSGYVFYALASFNADSLQKNDWRDRTGATYPILGAEAEQLKAMVRSNPGLMLLKNGVITDKWSNNDLPIMESVSAEAIEGTDSSSIPPLVKILLWFFIPLLVCIFVDRLWFGYKYYKHRSKILNLKENEKENRSRKLEDE